MRVVSLPVIILVASVNGLLPGLSGLPQLTAIRSEPQLDTRILAPNRAQYRSIRDEREWRNPHLLASNRGFELRSLSAPKPRVVRLEDLRRVLCESPIGDWPYGRVVVLQSPSIVPADDEWIAAMERNIDGARKILKALGVDEWAWPA